MLPNPTYGSWEPALFNNDWDQPAESAPPGATSSMSLQLAK